ARVERYVAGMAPPICWAWGELAVNAGDRLGERALDLQRGKRALVDRFVARADGAFCWVDPPQTAVFGWIRDRRGRDLFPLLERGIETNGVLVGPGRFFGDPSGFRLSWTAPVDVLTPGLAALGGALGLTE